MVQCEHFYQKTTQNTEKLQLPDPATGSGKLGRIRSLNNHAGSAGLPDPVFRIAIPKYRVQITVDDKNCIAEMDTGSAVSAVGKNLYKKLFAHKKLNRDNIILRNFEGQMFQPLGYFISSVTYLGTAVNIKICVVKEGVSFILGRDFLKNFRFNLQFFLRAEIFIDVSNCI